jgi:hypothetical protein
LDRGYADFYEKALFVKPTWRLYLVAERICFRPSRALCFYPHFRGLTLCGSPVHRMRSIFSVNLRRCDLPSGLSS